MHRPDRRLLVAAWLGILIAGGAAVSLGALQRSDLPVLPGDMLVYFGTYTGAKSKGVYVSRFDPRTGSVGAPELAAEAQSPSFLASHPTLPVLYAVSEVNTVDGKPGGSVSSFSLDRETGKLTLLNRQTSGGAGPAHLSVDPDGRNVLVANYGGGSVEVLPIDATGRLKAPSAFVQHTGSSVNPQRQKEPHAHAINTDPNGRFAYVPDLGLDKVMIYRFDPSKGSLAAATPPFAAVAPGSGPRHIAFHPSGRFAYVINEMLCTVTAMARDEKTGALKELQTVSSLPSGQTVQTGYSTAEIMVHPSGRYLYGSNRGHDSISVFQVDQSTGQLTFVANTPTGGKTPRGFGIDPTGGYLLAGNQNSDLVTAFRIDPKAGTLAATDQKIEVGAPVSVVFVRTRYVPRAR